MKFITAIFTTSFLLLSAIAAFNYYIDPVGVFYGGSMMEYTMAQQLSKANNISIQANYNERKFLKYRILLEDFKPDVLIFGSSRIMQIGIRTYPEKVFNLGVSGATIEDDIALVFMALKKFTPKKIILGIDPAIFNASWQEKRWVSLEQEYKESEAILLPGVQAHDTQTASALGLEDNSWDRWGQLLSFDYTMASYRKLLSTSGLSQNLTYEDDAPLADSDKIRKDGSRVYHLAYANTSQEEIDKKIDFYTYYTLENFSYSKQRMELLTKLLDYLQKRFTVEIFLPPYYPRVFEQMKTKVPGVQDVEAKVRVMAKENGIRVFGSYDPGKVHCTSDEFYDGMHPKDSCIKKIFDNAATLQPSTKPLKEDIK